MLKQVLIALLLFISSTALSQGVYADSIVIETKIIKDSDIIGSPFSVVYQLKNLSGVDFVIEELKINATQAINDIYEPLFTSGGIEGNDLNPKQSKFGEIFFQKDTINISSWRILGYFPNRSEITLRLKVQLAPELDELGEQVYDHSGTSYVNSTISLEFKPPLYAIIFGSIVGVLLLTILSYVYQLKKVIDNKATTPNRTVKYYLISLALSIIISVIVIIFLERIDDFPLPISIKVEDYLGGLIIGLLANRLSDSVLETLAIK